MIRFARNTKPVAPEAESKAKHTTAEESPKPPVKPVAGKKRRKTADSGNDQLL